MNRKIKRDQNGQVPMFGGTTRSVNQADLLTYRLLTFEGKQRTKTLAIAWGIYTPSRRERQAAT